VGTILYRFNNYTSPIVDVVYCAADSSTVYVVNGFEPPTDGYITSITSCPTATLEPTPIPEPTAYTEYYNCPDGTMWYILGENLPLKINRDGSTQCMTKVMEHATPPGGTQFFSYTSVNCICE
jgi:hypothetical protein